jgi:hypothetical protein
MQRQVEAARVAHDDRTAGKPLRGRRIEPEVRRVELHAPTRVNVRQPQMRQMHGISLDVDVVFYPLPE